MIDPHYILDEHGEPKQIAVWLEVIETVGNETVVKRLMNEKNLMRWARWMEDFRHNRQVARHFVHNKVMVSTVFLSLDHSFDMRPNHALVLWETMVFGGELDGEQERYTSKEDAWQGHYQMLGRVQRARQRPTYQQLQREHRKRLAELRGGWRSADPSRA